MRHPGEKKTRAGRALAVAAMAVIVPGLVWCAAICCHLCCLRRGFDACCVDD